MAIRYAEATIKICPANSKLSETAAEKRVSGDNSDFTPNKKAMRGCGFGICFEQYMKCVLIARLNYAILRKIVFELCQNYLKSK